nr:hypothetical protein Iba_chr07aCG14480 [Ipomoea batatas]
MLARSGSPQDSNHQRHSHGKNKGNEGVQAEQLEARKDLMATCSDDSKDHGLPAHQIATKLEVVLETNAKVVTVRNQKASGSEPGEKKASLEVKALVKREAVVVAFVGLRDSGHQACQHKLFYYLCLPLHDRYVKRNSPIIARLETQMRILVSQTLSNIQGAHLAANAQNRVTHEIHGAYYVIFYLVIVIFGNGPKEI